MPLTLRPTGCHPRLIVTGDYVIVEDGRDVGRLHEDRHSKPELRWFWWITVYVNLKLGIITSGRAASLERLRRNSWRAGRSAGREVGNCDSVL